MTRPTSGLPFKLNLDQLRPARDDEVIARLLLRAERGMRQSFRKAECAGLVRMSRTERGWVERQRLSGCSRAAICSTMSTMLRRSLASVIRVKARVSARPSEVARKSET